MADPQRMVAGAHPPGAERAAAGAASQRNSPRSRASRRPSRRRALPGELVLLGALGGWLAPPLIPPVGAEENPIATERSLTEAIESLRVRERATAAPSLEAAEETPIGAEGNLQKGVAPPNPEKEAGKGNERKKWWAILPQVGVSPEKGPNGGVKLTDRDFTPLDLTLDLQATLAAKGQQHVDGVLVSPKLGTDLLMLLAEGEFYTDPAKEFFGLGNNYVGPDELSTNRYERLTGTLGIGARLSRGFALIASGAYDEIDIRRGHREGSTPSTVDRFPDLVGIRGGRTNPLSLSLLFNNRQDLTRPTRGWSVIAKATWVPRGLGNDFSYRRYLLDAGYLYPLLTRRQVVGLHFGGQYLDGGARDVPFYELSSLGGANDLRGFFQDRFLGKAELFANAEYRLKLFDFDFFDIWHVQIDGVAFGDAGRVFFSTNEIARELGEPEQSVPRVDDQFRFSYGGGTRIALGEALVARIDVGFSSEETGLLYLVFGHTF